MNSAGQIPQFFHDRELDFQHSKCTRQPNQVDTPLRFCNRLRDRKTKGETDRLVGLFPVVHVQAVVTVVKHRNRGQAPDCVIFPFPSVYNLRYKEVTGLGSPGSGLQG
jgi:hypothetical protein